VGLIIIIFLRLKFVFLERDKSVTNLLIIDEKKSIKLLIIRGFKYEFNKKGSDKREFVIKNKSHIKQLLVVIWLL
jgi:hypothetical protein